MLQKEFRLCVAPYWYCFFYFFHLVHDKFDCLSGVAKNNPTGMAARSIWAECTDGKLVGLGQHNATYRSGIYDDETTGSVSTTL